MPFHQSVTAAGVCGMLVLITLWIMLRCHHIAKPPCKQIWTGNVYHYPFKAGDILLTSTAKMFNNFMVKNHWGHVAMIYRQPITQMLYVWETQFPVQGYWWTLTNSLKSKATRLTPLFRYLYRCKTSLCVRPLSHEVDCDRFAEFIHKKWDVPFDFNFLSTGANRIFMDLVNVPVMARTKNSGRFCAELAAETLVYLGVLNFQASLDPSLKSDCVIPGDFCQNSEHLPWVTGWSLGEEILLFR